MERAAGIEKVAKLMKHSSIGTLTTSSGKTLTSRPMGIQQVEFDGDLWFFTYKQSDKVSEIHAQPQVNVAIENSGSWISLSGAAETVDDKAKAEELWNPLLKAWFPDGLETEGLTLIKVHAESAEYWDSYNPQVIQLFGMIKAAVTGKQADGGENKTIQM